MGREWFRAGWARTVRRTIAEVVRECRRDRVTGLAAEIAFYAVLGFFPGILALAAMLGFLGAVVGEEQAARVSAEVVSFLNAVLTDKADPTLDGVRRLFEERSPGLLTLALLGALWAASRAFMAVIRSLDTAYDLEEGRGWFQARVTALGLAVCTVVVVAVTVTMVALGPLLGSARALAGVFGLGGAFATGWAWLRWPCALAILVVWTSVLFDVAPFHRTRWRWHLPGAAMSSALWLALTLGLQLYISAAQHANPVLGTLGGAVILLIWLYLLALGLLAGGELNAILMARQDVVSGPGHRWTFAWLGRFRSQLAGRSTE